MTTAAKLASRRRVLKGMLAGSAVTVGLPFLDCFLNENGTAVAATGQSLPSIYGSWSWSLGLNPGQWEPPTVGKITRMGRETAALERFKDKINLYGGLSVFTAGKSPSVHYTGVHAPLTGQVLSTIDPVPASIDTIIADHIGASTRFRSLQMVADGNARLTPSYRPGGIQQPGEISPAAMYARVFGPEFIDPNSANFKPDPRTMARQSVLSAVRYQSKSLEKLLGASDRARLDEYFTSLRQLEQQVDLQLQKPAPLPTCSPPEPVADPGSGKEVEVVVATHKLHAKIAAHALACDQTRVFNLAYTCGASGVYVKGDPQSHHVLTHEEPVDSELGCQRRVAYLNMRSMGAFADLLEALSAVREGDKTLLDRALILGVTDHGYARAHTLDAIPMITAGSANGRMKTGLYVVANRDPVTRLSLTVQQALGLPVGTWGVESMQTSKAISEVAV